MTHDAVSPELLLLLSCCRLQQNDWATQARDTAFNSGIASDDFLAIVERHRVAPLVFMQLKNDPRLQENVRLALRKRFVANRLEALKFKGFEQYLVSELSSQKVNFVFLKGMPLAEKYYGDIAFRHLYDLDILVDYDHVELIHSLLSKIRFRPDCNWPRFSLLQKAFYQIIHHDLAFIPEDGSKGLIEVHWRFRDVLQGFNLSEIRQLDQVEELLYLCTHGTEHAWFRLKWLCDVIQVLDAVEYDWEIVCQRAVQLECLAQLQVTWLLLNRLFDRFIPAAVERSMPVSKHRKKINHILFSINNRQTIYENDKLRFRHLLFSLGFKKRMGGLAIILRYMSSPADWKTLPLPDYLFWLYFPLRPLLLIWRKLR